MARNNNKAAAPATAAPAIVARVKAAGIIGKAANPLNAMARVAAVTGTAAASANRYKAAAHSLTPAFAAATFTLTPLGKAAVAANGGIGRNGQATVMGLVAVALGNAIAANGGTSATGAQVAAALLGNPQLMAATGGTKALGVHVTAANATAAKWAQGYINGLCRPAHGLANKA
jgi:hypothetical protein